MAAGLTAFVVVFLAEFGDRTQLLILALATRHRTGPVLAGLTLGYSLTNLLAVAIGGAVGASLPDRPVAIVSGCLFLAFAVWTLRDGGDDEEDDDEGEGEARSWPRLVLAIAGAVVVSEIGDKSMLATATLATEASPIATWVGATLGVVSAGAIGAAAGSVLADRVNHQLLRWAGAALFATVGIVMLARAF